ncbi:SpoIIE family protein phosphatase [Kitasatospora sp. NPDC049258]|uniref:ATP-binding SpoIIE family protein phosphatase n=1 Tax=Kitasatospora sp. NPDC049258 TaxID=3155394 RepID=UPI00342B0479
MSRSQLRAPDRAAAHDRAAVVVDAEGRLLLLTPAAAALLGARPGEACEPIGALLAERHEDGPHGIRLADATGAARAFDATVTPMTTDTTAGASGAPRWLVLLTPGEPPGPGGRLELSHRASARIGESLDLVDTAQTLANLLVPDFADLATVDLAEAVLMGDEPPRLVKGADVRLRRVAAAQGTDVRAEYLLRAGDAIPPVPDNALMRPLMMGRPVVVSDLDVLRRALTLDPQALRSFIPEGAHSSMAVPLYARGLVLGCLTLWRGGPLAPFGDEDAALLEEITSRAALSVDNARRYTKEHRAALALQRSLLPRSDTRLPAADTAGVYQPAGGASGVGGDWFDVIPLPSLRVALVVGDVVGHGLDATAAMARLRTAVQALADLDLEPEELLTHLDDLVLGFSAEHDHAGPDHAGPDRRAASSSSSASGLALVGATCLYAVYDPVTGRCSAASAGHPPLVVCAPGQQPAFLEAAPGPPLGVGTMPFGATEFEVPEGTTLALCTDGLLAGRTGDLEDGMGRLGQALGETVRPGAPLGESAQAVFDRVLPPSPTDDAALLLARTRRLPRDQVAAWEFEADLSLVARARALVVDRLTTWGLEELAFVTELVVSELVTNAIRYAGAPVGLRLIRAGVLVCEVSDPSSTQPRLRRARETDEGGRGLFLVAQLTDRWGSRFTGGGKTIWSEQAIPAGAGAGDREGDRGGDG